MVSETDFSELGNSLTTGFFADNVILVLARTERLGRLQNNDKKTVREAVSLIDNILQGQKWLDKRRINSKSAETALALNRAVKAVPEITIPEEFVLYINELKSTLSNVLKSGQENSDKIRELRKFFYNYAKALSAESQNIVERSSEPSRVELCAQLGQESI